MNKPNVVNLIEKEIKSTLECEQENALHYASSISEADDIHKGWIEALQYVLDVINIKKAVVSIAKEEK